MSTNANHINELLSKAAQADKSEDAVKFSQSACNIAHVLRVLADLKQEGKPS